MVDVIECDDILQLVQHGGCHLLGCVLVFVAVILHIEKSLSIGGLVGSHRQPSGLVIIKRRTT